MGFRYIIGRAGRGKTHYLLEEIQKKINQQTNRIILLVPEQFTLQAERDLIEKLNLPGLMGVEVLSFSRLAHYVFNEAGGLTRVYMNEQGKNMVLRKIVDEVNKDLTVYKKASEQSGFIEMLSQLLSELKQFDILPEDLYQQANEMNNEQLLRKKLQDIAYIYDQFNQYAKENYMDSEDAINLLIEKIEQSAFLQCAEIWIDGFYTLTPQMYRIIEKLGLIAKNLTFTITMDTHTQGKDGDLFKLSYLHYKHIQEIARRHHFSEEVIDLNQIPINKRVKSSEIHHIEQEFYAYPYQVYAEKTKDITLYAGMNLQTEVEQVAAKIVALVRDQGLRWRDIAVISNDLENYGPLIKRVFAEYQIPYFLDQTRTIMHNPIIELILSSLEVIERNYPYEPVFRLLKTGFTGIDPDLYEKLENYVLRYGVKGKKWKKPFNDGDKEALDELNKVRERFIKSMKPLEQAMKGKKTVEERTRALYEYLHGIHLDEQLEDWIDHLKKLERYEYVNEYTQIWNLVTEIFDQLVEMIGEHPIHLKKYIRVLESGFLSIKIGIIPTTIDQVLIGNMQRSKSHDIKALFILGVNDGIIPLKNVEEGILADDEKMTMKEKGLILGSDSERKAYEEKLMIYAALSKPSQYLWISYSMGDQEGKAIRPSILIDRFKRIFPQLEIKNELEDRIKNQKDFISTPMSTFKYLVENVRRYLDGQPIENIWWDVYQWYQKEKSWNEKRTALLDGLFHSNQLNNIGMDTAKRLYQTPIRASVSRLEQFANCPFSHFVKYGLKPKERKMYKVEAPDLGEIFHYSLELFTNKLKEQGIIWQELDKQTTDKMMDQVVDQIIPNHGNGIMLSSNRYKYLVHRLKRISRRAAWTIAEHMKRSGFQPIGFEVGFGFDQPFPPIEITLPDGETIYLEGRIDRVDIYDDGEKDAYVRIIDYKSGVKDFSLSDVYHGLQLQLMVYLEAMLSKREIWEQKKLKPAGIFYFKIDDPMIQTREKIIEKIEGEIRRKLKMKGLVLKDVNIVKQMDREIDGYSEIIPVGLKKNDEFYSNSSAVDDEKFTALLYHVHHLVTEISQEMLKGYIRIEPVKNGNQLACQFCSYQAICQFDQRFHDNNYKAIRKMSDQLVIQTLSAEMEGSKDGEMDN